MTSLLINAVGTAAALCSMASFTPQIIKIWRDRDADSVSLKTYGLTVAGFACWIAYGVMLRSWPIAVSNSVSLLLSASVLILKWRLSRGGTDPSGPRS